MMESVGASTQISDAASPPYSPEQCCGDPTQISSARNAFSVAFFPIDVDMSIF